MHTVIEHILRLLPSFVMRCLHFPFLPSVYKKKEKEKKKIPVGVWVLGVKQRLSKKNNDVKKKKKNYTKNKKQKKNQQNKTKQRKKKKILVDGMSSRTIVGF